MQVLSRPTRGGCLGGVPLCHAQFSDGFDQRGKAGDKRDLGADRVIAECGGGQQPGRMAQAVPDRRGARDASVGATGGAVIGVMAASNRQQAYATEPVQRMFLGTVMQGEPGLGQRLGDVTGQGRQGIIGGQGDGRSRRRVWTWLPLALRARRERASGPGLEARRGRRRRAASRYGKQAEVLAAQLRALRGQAGLTQEQLAASAGVAVATVRKIETGAVVEPG